MRRASPASQGCAPEVNPGRSIDTGSLGTLPVGGPSKETCNAASCTNGSRIATAPSFGDDGRRCGGYPGRRPIGQRAAAGRRRCRPAVPPAGHGRNPGRSRAAGRAGSAGQGVLRGRFRIDRLAEELLGQHAGAGACRPHRARAGPLVLPGAHDPGERSRQGTPAQRQPVHVQGCDGDHQVTAAGHR